MSASVDTRSHALPRYGRRVVRALTPLRLGVALLMTLLVSTGVLTPQDVYDFYSPGDIAVAWFEYVLELLPIAVGMTLVFTLADEALPAHAPWRLLPLCGALLMAAVAFQTIHLGLLQGFENLSASDRMAAPILNIAIPAVFCAVLAAIDRRTDRIEAARRQAEAARAALELQATELQVSALQAQIEPHFLFNTLANVRRLYRTRPQSGASMIASLMRYLHLALPQMRRSDATLGDEVALVRAYLELFQVRMGRRLSYEIDVGDDLARLEFPPMLLLTLVENALAHGLDPSPEGGHVTVAAHRTGSSLQAVVADDGVGFAMAGAGGTGMGLANIQRQLNARYGVHGRLELSAGEPRGVRALICVPARPARQQAAAAATPVAESVALPATAQEH